MRLFSSPIELGLRVLFVLDAAPNQFWHLDRLVVYDYLLVHSADAGGPYSLHPATPYRSGELLIKRDILREGLKLMASRELVNVRIGEAGLEYGSSTITSNFLEYLRGDYFEWLWTRAAWIADAFNAWDDDRLDAYVREHLDVWGGEFTNDSVLRSQAEISTSSLPGSR